jgi:hypothetical protein
MTNDIAFQSEQLPSNLREFFAALVVHDADTAAQFLTPDVIAVDEGKTWRGRDEVYLFVRDAGAEFEVDTEVLGARRIDDSHFIIAVRLTGNFPGGTADLDYRFALRDGLITELVIGAPEA